MLISIVIPCYYSEKTIKKVVEMTIDEFSKTNRYDCEFVLVNDGSTDGTDEEIMKFLHEMNKGTGRKISFCAGRKFTEKFWTAQCTYGSASLREGRLCSGHG